MRSINVRELGGSEDRIDYSVEDFGSRLFRQGSAAIELCAEVKVDGLRRFPTVQHERLQEPPND